MERFVFVVAVAAAVIFGIVAVFGGPDFHFSFDDSEGLGTAELVSVAPGRMEPEAFAGTDLVIKAAAAVVTIVPEDRTDFSIEIDNAAGRAPMPSVTIEGDRVVVDGHLRGRIGDCGDEAVELRGYDNIPLAQLPHVTIRAPRTFSLDRGGAGSTEIGATQELRLDIASCGTTTVADVAGELRIDLAGSGTVIAGAAGSLDADVAGSGEMTVGAVASGASIDIAGSGTVAIASLTGELSSDGAGSGSLTIADGAISTASIDLAGSGDVSVGATIETLEVDIVGSGNVEVTAPIRDLDAEIAGSGNVAVAAVTGTVRREIWGSGEVQVGQ